jgi:hypothetical protein
MKEIADIVPIKAGPETTPRIQECPNPTVYITLVFKYLSSTQDPWREPRAPTPLQPLPHLPKWTLRYALCLYTLSIEKGRAVLYTDILTIL